MCALEQDYEKKFNKIFTKGDERIIQSVYINGERVLALFDPGAEVSAISRRVAYATSMPIHTQHTDLILGNGKTSSCEEAIDHAHIMLSDRREVKTHMIVTDMSQKYDVIIGMTDLLSLGISMTGLPNGLDPNKDQSDDNMLKVPKPPTGEAKEMIPHFTDIIMDLILQNRKIKITDWCMFKFSNGYVKLDLTNVDFSKLKCPSHNYVSWRHKDVVRTQIEDWLKQGLIEINYDATPVNLALLAVDQYKSDGSFSKTRVVLDLSPINKLIPQHSFPLPKISEILRKMEGATIFTKIDLKSAFHQLQIYEPHRKYFSFTWQGKKYQFKGAPEGLHLLPSFFQQVMMELFADLSDNVSVYLDDIVIFTKTKAEHTRLVKEVLRRLNAANLKINEDKCSFAKDTIHLLGYKVSAAGVEIDPGKKQFLLDLSTPITGRDVNSVCGFVNFFSDSVPHLSHYLQPFSHLRLHKGPLGKLWTKECDDAFKLVKSKVMDAPIMQYPVDGVPFEVATDASDRALGGVLYQTINGKPRYIQFFSKSYNKSQRNYPTVKQELLAIVTALRQFKDYLYGSYFTVACDQKSLTYLKDMNPDSQLVSRWHDIIAKFAFTITHIPGIHNHLPDMLSRLVPDFQKTVRELLATDWMLNKKWFQLSESRWGPFTIDLFAADHNKQVPEYRSLTHPKGDAFQVDLTKHNAWACPPWQLIPQLLNYVNITKATITLCCPLRNSDPWMRELMKMIQDEPIYVDRETDTFLYQGSYSIKKTPWKHTMVCRIGPAGTTKWKPSAEFLAKLEESKQVDNQLKTHTTHAPNTTAVEVMPFETALDRTNMEIAKSVDQRLKTMSEPEARTHLLQGLLKEQPGVAKQLLEILRNSNVVNHVSEKRISSTEPEVALSNGDVVHPASVTQQLSDLEELESKVKIIHNLTHRAFEHTYKMALRAGLDHPALKETIREVYRRCTDCEKNQIKRYGWAPLKSVSEDQPMRRVIVDLVKLPRSKHTGDVYVCHFLCVASGYNLLYAIPNKRPQTVAELCYHVFNDFGFPRVLCSDNGSEFCTDVMEALILVSGMTHRRGVPYKPQTQGANETRHRELKKLLRTALDDVEDMWPYHLKWVQTQMNNCMNPQTGTLPFHYFFGRCSELQATFDKTAPEKHVTPWLQKLEHMQNVVYPCLQEHKNKVLLKAHDRWNNTKNIVQYKVGDYVNIINRNANVTELSSKTTGPFIISYHDEKSDTYEVNNIDGTSATNLGTHRIPTSEISFARSFDSDVPVMESQVKDIIDKTSENGYTYYKTRFMDGTVVWLTSDAFRESRDFLRNFNKKWNKRLHKNTRDKRKGFPKVTANPDGSEIPYLPPTSYVTKLSDLFTNSDDDSSANNEEPPAAPRRSKRRAPTSEMVTGPNAKRHRVQHES